MSIPAKPRHDVRLTVYLGTAEEGGALLQQIKTQLNTDTRFRGSPTNFIRYATAYTLANDPSLKRK